MIVAIHQPTFFPWLGWWDKLARADLLVLLDDVQFPKKGGTWMNRTRILSDGEPSWLTIPVDRSFHGFRTVNETRTDETKRWRERLVRQVQTAYEEADHFDVVMSVVGELLGDPEVSLASRNDRAVRRVAREIGLESRIVRSSELDVGSASGTERLVRICAAVGGSAYLSGDGSAGYLDPALFAEAGLDLLFQGFRQPVYPQPAATFHPGLSIVDVAMNCGWSAIRGLLGATA